MELIFAIAAVNVLVFVFLLVAIAIYLKKIYKMKEKEQIRRKLKAFVKELWPEKEANPLLKAYDQQLQHFNALMNELLKNDLVHLKPDLKTKLFMDTITHHEGFFIIKKGQFRTTVYLSISGKGVINTCELREDLKSLY